MNRQEQMFAAEFLRIHLPRLNAIPSRLQRIREGLRLWKSLGLDPAAFWHWLHIARDRYRSGEWVGSAPEPEQSHGFVWEIRFK